MKLEGVRHSLDRLIRERRETYGSVSRLLGRNPAYVQQFIKRGVPLKLDEHDRRKLATYFNVNEAVLGGSLVERQLHDLPAWSSGNTLPLIDGSGDSPFIFEDGWLGSLTATAASRLTILRVEGDTMSPTLADGDHVIVDEADASKRLRDGLYAIETRGVFHVRRIALSPQSGCVKVGCDNPAYPVWSDRRIDDLTLAGRAVWIGRSLS